MTTLGDLLSDGAAAVIAKKTIQIGDVYEINMDRSNGIIPPNGDSDRNKYFIVLGVSEDIVYGGVIINSRINPHVSESVRLYHMPIKKEDHPFLRYNSFVDCSRLKTATLEKFRTWKYMASFPEEEVNLIISTIKSSPNESAARLAMFNL